MKYSDMMIEKWFEENKEPNIQQFENYNETYVKLWIDPWFGMNGENPPQSYFNGILDCYSQLYKNWKNYFANKEIICDLQVWLFEKNYRKIELVAAKIDQPLSQRNNYFRTCPEKRVFPKNQFRSDEFDPDKFDWKLFFDTDEKHEKLDALNKGDIESLLADGYKEELVNGERSFWKVLDHVWVGRII
ncbi:MAG: hypothetical protein K9N09_03135 [Candidatus Cloacimonetes bacterium]|nr:hypothetical protein [Candidatus Cloacimonadota bacterium]MCF7814538.1 hypothetical protein [Candidatus Cloacimonadota bacterium]MCF7867670.1 hypothetical protein [Candidatus Cloacimonadota bacterium]MCF7883532.1 hypothetical protein [Candidatus Cloacimonadota bacterium]